MTEDNSVIRFKQAINFSIWALIFDSLLSFIVVVLTQILLMRMFHSKSNIPIKISHLVKTIFHLTSLLYISAFYYIATIKSLKPKIIKFAIALLILVIVCLFSDLLNFSSKYFSIITFSYLSKINLILWDSFYLLGLIFLFSIFSHARLSGYRNFSALLMALYTAAFVFYRLPALFLKQFYHLKIFPFLNLTTFFLAVLILLSTLFLLFILKRKINKDFLTHIQKP